MLFTPRPDSNVPGRSALQQFIILYRIMRVFERMLPFYFQKSDVMKRSETVSGAELSEASNFI
jgi:hypothetical protein